MTIPVLKLPDLTLGDIAARDRNCFGTIRLAAALAVVISHVTYLQSGQSGQEPLFALTGYSLGQHAVHVFFVLSGFMVTASLVQKPDLPRFLFARVLRIFPGLIVCVLLLAFVLGPLMSTQPLVSFFSDPTTYQYVVRTILLTTGHAPLPGVFALNPITGKIDIPLWTLKYEVMAYLLLAAGFAISQVLRPALVTVIGWLALAGLALVLVLLPGKEAESANALRFLFAFGLGVAACAVRQRIAISLLWPLAGFGLYGLAFSTPFQASATILLTATLALYVGAWPLPAWLKTAKPVDLSFGVYMYGWPVTQVVLALGLATSVPGVIAAALAIILPLAALSWIFVEQPALSLRSLNFRRHEILPAGL